MTAPGILDIEQSVSKIRSQLVHHRLYRLLNSLPAMRMFMEVHAFAVWDFMSLLKSLQHELTCLSVPWRPVVHSSACRLVNEIVLAEESDIGPDGEIYSHFQLYLNSMEQAGSDSGGILELLNRADSLTELQGWLLERDGDCPGAAFVSQTFDIIQSQDVCAVAAAFCFGREDVLPDLFLKIVSELNRRHEGKLSQFEYYLNRHIELDGDEHSQMAAQLMVELCGESAERWESAKRAAKASLIARLALWDAIADKISDQLFRPGSLVASEVDDH